MTPPAPGTRRTLGIEEEQLAVEDLREKFVEIDAGVFAAKAEDVGAVHPADGVDEVVVVLGLVLVRRRRGAELESGTEQAELVDGIGDAVGWAVDAQIGGGDRARC